MMHTVLDYSLFEDFTNNQPLPVPVGTFDENEHWRSFWKFLKQGCDLTITNIKEWNNIFLNDLTTGRKGTRLNTKNKFNRPHKCKLPGKTFPHTVYFLNEENNDVRVKYRTQNGFLFGFKNDYQKTWEELSLYGKQKVLPVARHAGKELTEWQQLSDYITPFTDLIIIDNYMFDESVWDYNLFEILKIFADKTPVKFNLLLVSFVPKEKLSLYQDIEQKIKEKIKELHINCNLTIALAYRQVKEHDRVIITNYLKIKSGDSFIYFDKNGKPLTRGTEIDFASLSEPDVFYSVKVTLKHVGEIMNKLNNHSEKEKRLFGNGKCGLIDN